MEIAMTKINAESVKRADEYTQTDRWASEFEKSISLQCMGEIFCNESLIGRLPELHCCTLNVSC